MSPVVFEVTVRNMKGDYIMFTRKFKNIHDDEVWTLEELRQLRNDHKKQGIDVYDSFDKWMSVQLCMDFVEIYNNSMEQNMKG